MDIFNAALNSILRGYHAALSFVPPVARLTLLALLAAMAMLWVFKRTSKPKRIKSVKRLIQAHLLEMRLFRDEPAVVWRAQGSLLSSNARYIGLMLAPALWLAIPLTLLMIHLDAFYGRSPLTVGQEAIVTMAMSKPVESLPSMPVLVAPQGIAVETSPVRVVGDKQISWRIRPSGPVSGSLQFQVDGQTVEKQIETGPGSRFIAGMRPSSLWESIWHPDESRIQSPAVEWIDIRYPAVDMSIFGIQLHWILWFTILSMVIALLLRKRFGVIL